jgi:hypothetical protein
MWLPHLSKQKLIILGICDESVPAPPNSNPTAGFTHHDWNGMLCCPVRKWHNSPEVLRVSHRGQDIFHRATFNKMCFINSSVTCDGMIRYRQLMGDKYDMHHFQRALTVLFDLPLWDDGPSLSTLVLQLWDIWIHHDSCTIKNVMSLCQCWKWVVDSMACW